MNVTLKNDHLCKNIGCIEKGRVLLDLYIFVWLHFCCLVANVIYFGLWDSVTEEDPHYNNNVSSMLFKERSPPKSLIMEQFNPLLSGFTGKQCRPRSDAAL